MKWKNIVCGMAAFMLSVTLNSVSAMSPGFENAYPLADKTHELTSVSGLTARGGGSVDYFSLHDKNGNRLRMPKQFHSADGGATWGSVDLSWYKTYLSQNYPKAESTRDAYMAQNGDIYLSTITSSEVKQSGNSGFRYRNFSVFKYSSGKISEITPLRMGYFGGVGMDILDVSPEGDIVVFQETYLNAFSDLVKEQPSYVCVYNAKTNTATKVGLKDAPRGWSPLAYANNAVFGIRRDDTDDVIKLDAYDVRTGKLSLTITVPGSKGKDYIAVMLAKGPNNALYILAPSGIYRLDAGGKQPVKVSDMTSTRLEKNAAQFCGTAAYDPDGALYTALRYANPKKGPAKNDDFDGRIYRYKLP